jgi:predicted transposase YdaD
VTERDLPGIIKEIDHRLHRRAWRRRAGEVWAATNILMGLRYNRELIQTLMQGVLAMKESVTYQAILEEGEAKGLAKGGVSEAKRLLLLLGTKRFGAPDARSQAALEALDDLARLEDLGVRLLDAESWHDLLGKPARRRGTERCA